MINSNKGSSTSKHTVIPYLEYSKWMKELQSFSKKYKKYGSFLPPQEKLLGRIYRAIFETDNRVVAFTAPPASGKTHAIVLCAVYLYSQGVSTCIVTPCNELVLEFQQELKEIDANFSGHISIMSIRKYMKRKSEFEFALIDEAHNLRTAIELDSDVVRNIHVERSSPLYDGIVAYLSQKGRNVVNELCPESTHDLLHVFTGSEHEREAQRLLRRLSEWRCFTTITEAACDLRFLLADPDKRNILPSGRLYLFSATLLDPHELQFYCGIPSEAVQVATRRPSKFIPKESVSYFYIPCATDEDKMRIAVSLLRDAELPGLILLNCNSRCLEWSAKLSRELEDRIITVKSGLDFLHRLQLYRKFTERHNSILLTSSSVYWEGITIKNLKLLIIPNLPYPQPSLLEVALNKNTQYHKLAMRRLIQGMGRIGRTPREKGVCLLLFRPKELTNHVGRITEKKVGDVILKLEKTTQTL